ncbi:MAG: hypothetical protein AAGU27_28890 [Dehalobacterium sp.]
MSALRTGAQKNAEKALKKGTVKLNSLAGSGEKVAGKTVLTNR